MEWDCLLKPYRLGCPKIIDKNCDRGEFHRDYDRIIFWAAFRRLQCKTQVFPFPETDIMHTRLTHSLEAASVGRSLGTIVCNELRIKEIQNYEMGALVSAACLSHDIGNPPLGHSGESAIAEFFQSKQGQDVLNGLTEEQKMDFCNFEGNSMGFHLLSSSNSKITKVKGGLGLTYATLSAFIKYPRSTNFIKINEINVSEKKPGLFSCDLPIYDEIASELGIPRKERGDCWYRHPLAFLTEAADDICYHIVDLEDGYKHGLISFKTTFNYLLEIVNTFENSALNNLDNILDERNQIGYLRAKAINSLIYQVTDVFKENEKNILNGSFDKSLISCSKSREILREIQKLSIAKIYSHRPVVQTEAAGFQVLPGLLSTFFDALSDTKRASSKKILSLVPDEFIYNFNEQKYDAIMSITTYVAGMTDVFALDTYRNLKGIQLPNF